LTNTVLFGIVLQLDMSTPELVDAVVEEALPNTMFRIRLPDGELKLSYLAGKMTLETRFRFALTRMAVKHVSNEDHENKSINQKNVS
jgi:hypothetical protein